MRATAQTGIVLIGLAVGLALWAAGHGPTPRSILGITRHEPATTTPPRKVASSSATLISTAKSGKLNIPNSPSSNWVGVATTNLTATSVEASWTVPTWTGAEPRSSVGNWVGLGGSSSKQLIQVGTVTKTNKQGNAVTRAFWEQLPHSAIMGTTIPVGTKITAKIVPDGTYSWELELVNFKTGVVLMKKEVQLGSSQATGVERSADIITERVTGNHGLIRLAPFGQTIFSGIHVNQTPLADLPVSDLTGDWLESRLGTVAAPYYKPQKPDAMTVQEQQSANPAPVPVTFPDGYGYGYGRGYGRVRGFGRGDGGFGGFGNSAFGGSGFNDGRNSSYVHFHDSARRPLPSYTNQAAVLSGR